MSQVEIDFPPELPPPLNPLHRIIIGAGILLRIEDPEVSYRDPLGWLDTLSERADASTLSQAKIYQINAVQRTVERLRGEGLEIIYVDELAWSSRGFDIVALDKANARIVVVESKATSKPFSKSIRSYLRSTRSKGRQMSWEWIWKSTLELAEIAASVPTFFRTVRPVLEGRCERRLYVWTAETGAGQLVGTSAYVTFAEADFAKFDELNDRIDARFPGWLAEIDASCPYGGIGYFSNEIAD